MGSRCSWAEAAWRRVLPGSWFGFGSAQWPQMQSSVGLEEPSDSCGRCLPAFGIASADHYVRTFAGEQPRARQTDARRFLR